MASSSSESSTPSLEQLTTRRTTSLLLPWIISMATTANSTPREIAVYLHHPTQSITVIEGNLDVESILREIPTTQGPMPASRSSIDSLPRVGITEPGSECAICLAEYEVDHHGEIEVKEMPCGHIFHSGCIDKWLGIRGSCPVCRFSMPVEVEKRESVEEGWRIHVVFGRGRSGAGREEDPDPDGGMVDELQGRQMDIDDHNSG